MHETWVRVSPECSLFFGKSCLRSCIVLLCLFFSFSLPEHLSIHVYMYTCSWMCVAVFTPRDRRLRPFLKRPTWRLVEQQSVCMYIHQYVQYTCTCTCACSTLATCTCKFEVHAACVYTCKMSNMKVDHNMCDRVRGNQPYVGGSDFEIWAKTAKK